ncbi:MAG: hypothetical protein FP825_06810 [Hyphomonas sp.]|uniref:hypothetical protein n=1 Tax=Hyphomonas sp. TaxID=87 RepID=UPI0017E4B93E|nr:hypothetical protein [Hyphomonas sp.]MBU3919834.1 hypothetical protein [Alphaproteobacteria bacterium]MBA3068171.1 hypothetical protein [Hyphomonas sp.]MBU4062094.1 hypothetical protein [Alphaproteobacteria bacterium]MBU4165528.1 hypothetical protein [Alphaproteobacteria bacterium]MBU4569101.1 hypothetical protein [Alphaproteobacteria bacterium]
MQTLKFEMVMAGLALFALGAFVATRPTSAEAAAIEPVAARAFTEADFARFDRGFVLDKARCAVGMQRYKMCFAPSPLEARMQTGMVVPQDVPLVTAEFRVIVETTLKEEPLRTVRFGQTLALVDPETRIVVDMIRLTAPDLAAARQPAPGIG